jgi:GMP synthase-like glutamine amidotransferase
MILLINISKERLHYYEFVKPIEDILKKENIEYHVKDYKDIENKDLVNSDKIIICGTSIYDNYYLKHIKKFSWLKEINKPVLGICGGMQIIGLVFNGKLKKATEIGFFYERIKKEFFGLQGVLDVYHLHNNYVVLSTEFENYSDNKIAQVIKHRLKPIYGVLFHPEVRQRNIIINFAK